MGTKVTKSTGGILIPSSRCVFAELDATLSSYTQAGSRPGVAVASDDLAGYRSVVEGEQSAEIVVVAVDADTLAYRLGTESSGAERGWDVPNVMTGFGPLEYSITSSFLYHDCVTLLDGRVLAINSTSNDTTPTVQIFDPSDRSVTAVSTPTLLVGTGKDHLAMGIRPDGRVFLAISDQIWTADAADGYVAWTRRSRTPYAGQTSSAPAGQRAMAYSPAGGWVMLVNDAATDYEQWASVDGVSWVQVEGVDTVGDLFDVASFPDGSFLVTYIEQSGSAVRAARIGSAWSKLSSATLVQPDNLDGACHAAACAIYPDGRAYTYWVLSAAGHVHVSESLDAGATWTRYIVAANYFGSAQVYPDTLRATVVESQVYVQHQHTSNLNTHTSVWWMVFGGWSQVQLGPLGEYRGGYGGTASRVYTPYELPGTTVWTLTTSGGTEAVAAGYLRNTTGGATSIDYSRTGWGASTSLECHWAINEYDGPGNASGTDGAFVRLTPSTGVNDYDVEVRIGNANYDVYDLNAAASLGTGTVDTTGGLEWRFEINAGDVTVWHRTQGASIWTKSVDAVAALAAAGTTERIRWGCRNNVAVCDWAFLQGPHTDADLYFDGTDSLGRELPAQGRGVAIPDVGTSVGPARLSAVGVAAMAGQEWTHTPRYDYPASAVFPDLSPSPRVEHRQTGTTELIYGWDFGRTTHMGRVIGLYIGRTNVRTWVIESSATAVAWSNRGTLDLATGWTGLAYQLAGDLVRPLATGGGSSGAWPLEAAELMGSIVTFAGGESRYIDDNDAGVWKDGGTAATDLLPRVRMAAADGSEAGASLLIQRHSGAVVFHAPTTGMEHRYWRIRAAASQVIPQTDDGYRVGSVVFGEVVPFGDRLDFGWSDTHDENYRSTTSGRGTEQRSKEGPVPRSWTLPFGELKTVQDSTDPDYVGLTGRIPAGPDDGVNQALVALLKRTGSGAVPVVCLKVLPDTNDTEVVDPRLLLYGHATGSVRMDHIGSSAAEVEGQMYHRVSRFTVDEVI
ncbi:MAG: hypothetical protein GY913_00795 [Proteobacteria bacterium]|nr:hypothetical protein [Pseudomonadota bacterium]